MYEYYDPEYYNDTKDIEINKYLDRPYGTKNSAEWKKNGGIILSPSGITKFFNNSAEWYSDRLGQPTFAGNTKTVHGTAIHANIESVLEEQKPISIEEINAWTKKRYSTNPNVDRDEVSKLYLKVSPLVNEYLYDLGSIKPTHIEYEVEYVEDTQETIDIATMGTLDAIYGDTIVDWKTCESKPQGIGNYRYQLMQYARALKKLDVIEPKYIKIVYFQSPTKTLPARIWEFKEKITSKDWIEAEYFAELQIGSLMLAAANPEAKDLIFRVNPTTRF